MTIEEKLAPYKETNISFYEAYKHCMPIEEIEGHIIKGIYSGYQFTDNNGNCYFTDYGIRGTIRGMFRIQGGTPHEVLEMPEYETLNYICDLIYDILKESPDTNKHMLSYYVKKIWYDKQK